VRDERVFGIVYRLLNTDSLGLKMLYQWKTIMSKYHYTYILTERSSGMRYIGVRSCDCEPKEDEYWGSSKYLPDGYCGNLSGTFDKTIVGSFESREEANEDEIRLHNLHDVAVNPRFYNRAKATSKGFCVYGTKHSEATREKMSVTRTGDKNGMYGKHHSAETREKMSVSTAGEKHPMYGKQHSDETLEKMSKVKMGDTHNQKYPNQIWWKHKVGAEIFASSMEMRDLYDKDGYTSDFVKVYKGINKTCRGWALKTNNRQGEHNEL